MNQNQTELIREWLQLHYLVKEAIDELNELKNSRISMKFIVEAGLKNIGRTMRNRMQEITKSLRASGIHVGVKDEGGELIEVWTVTNGLKDNFMIKRAILREDMDKRMERFMKDLEDNQVDRPYKPEISSGDTYEDTYKK